MQFRRTFALGAALITLIALPLSAQWPMTEKLDLDAIYRIKDEGLQRSKVMEIESYLTDVYVVKEHQGKGLGRWMMQCLNEVISAWPEMRRFFILTSEPEVVRLYEKTLGARDVLDTPSKLVIMNRLGPAAQVVALVSTS